MKMELHCWFYVSRSLIEPAMLDEETAAIVSVSRLRNEQLDVTGALVLAQGRFSQFIEGPLSVIERLRTSIERDPRHHQVTTLKFEPVDRRSFTGWALAYAGPASFIARKIDISLLDAVGKGEPARETLMRLLQELRS
ncbi:hypothetical protein FHS96_005642 [Sphingomonas zeicaulis]|uniref:BLUF domain-containing protein n=1 Tax=Sphingomonas zeicaulis TaxID=1632740 RepID=UPI003D1D39F7